jgi:hypothetical protein
MQIDLTSGFINNHIPNQDLKHPKFIEKTCMLRLNTYFLRIFQAKQVFKTGLIVENVHVWG